MKFNLLPLQFDSYNKRKDRMLTIVYKNPNYGGLYLFVHSPLEMPYFNMASKSLILINNIVLYFNVNYNFILLP